MFGYVECLDSDSQTRCMWADDVNHCWGFGDYFKDKTTVENGKFIGGFLRNNNENKSAETHEFWIFKADGCTRFKWRTRQDHGRMSEGKVAKDFWGTRYSYYILTLRTSTSYYHLTLHLLLSTT